MVMGPYNGHWYDGQFLALGLTVYETWELKIDFQAEANAGIEWMSIFEVAVGDETAFSCADQMGCRIPSLFLAPQSDQFYFTQDIAGAVNSNFIKNLDNSMHRNSGLSLKQPSFYNEIFLISQSSDDFDFRSQKKQS